MKRAPLIAALAAVAALALSAAPAPAQQRAAQRDWTQNVARTPEGGFRMGNPAASVKVIEYLSLTCPHCAAFAAEVTPLLIRDHVRTGRVSLEYRNYILNGYDLAASFISRCAPPSHYFELNHFLLSNQRQWMGRIEALTDAQRAELRGLPPLAAMQRIVILLGLDAIAARHGVPESVQRTCLADQAALDRIGTMRQAAERDFGVDRTPTFVVNGRKADHVHDWASLEPLLRAR